MGLLAMLLRLHLIECLCCLPREQKRNVLTDQNEFSRTSSGSADSTYAWTKPVTIVVRSISVWVEAWASPAFDGPTQIFPVGPISCTLEVTPVGLACVPWEAVR